MNYLFPLPSLFSSSLYDPDPNHQMDIPEVAAKAPLLLKQLQDACGHTRVMAISAVADPKKKQGLSSDGGGGGLIVDLMRRTAKLVGSQPEPPTFAETSEGLEAERINLDRGAADADAHLSLVGARGFRFEIDHDPVRHPGQFRVRSNRIESMVRMTRWEYYEASTRFERVLEATGILRLVGCLVGCLLGWLVACLL
jgi:hypothetical protein